ncbi:MAG: type II toxin-antitoxin system VapC family toxin [Symploca sp. SIO3E6]|nr:type II toxin-antitoxin system VapC family toxin [Caldora sp. SIO3E6]
MKIAYLIDTNIFILLFNNRLQEPIPEGDLSYSVITEIELLSFPNLSEEDEALIQQNLALLQRVAIEREVAQKAILLRRKYRLKTPDAIIVASAWIMNAVLLTNDRKLNNVSEIQTKSLALKEKS